MEVDGVTFRIMNGKFIYKDDEGWKVGRQRAYGAMGVSEEAPALSKP